MTAYKYGDSQRLMVARETLKSKTRQKLPLIVVMLDGVAGYWDEQKVYWVKSSVIQYLVALSTNYRVVGVAIGQSKKCVKKLCSQLAEKGPDRQPFVFDAVYLLRKPE